ncbi:unnamed protein product, partial [marine sediment metagenome]
IEQKAVPHKYNCMFPNFSTSPSKQTRFKIDVSSLEVFRRGGSFDRVLEFLHEVGEGKHISEYVKETE